jgi:hypothetical protein
VDDPLGLGFAHNLVHGACVDEVESDRFCAECADALAAAQRTGTGARSRMRWLLVGVLMVAVIVAIVLLVASGGGGSGLAASAQRSGAADGVPAGSSTGRPRTTGGGRLGPAVNQG